MERISSLQPPLPANPFSELLIEKNSRRLELSISKNTPYGRWGQGPGSVDPRFPAGLPFPVPENLEFVAFRDSGKYFQQFSRDFPGVFLENPRTHPGNSHSLLEFSDISAYSGCPQNMCLGERLRGNRSRGNRPERFREFLGSLRVSETVSERTPGIGELVAECTSQRSPGTSQGSSQSPSQSAIWARPGLCLPRCVFTRLTLHLVKPPSRAMYLVDAPPPSSLSQGICRTAGQTLCVSTRPLVPGEVLYRIHCQSLKTHIGVNTGLGVPKPFSAQSCRSCCP